MICRICGKPGEGQSFDEWVRDTFTNFDLLRPGEIICNDCLFWFDQRSTDLQHLMGKDKPQKMQNYSHFIKSGQWQPMSKADKPGMAAMMLTPPFPELAVIADSGQKHLAFRARRNPAGQAAGWVQFEEAQVYVDPPKLAMLLSTVERLYTAFSKAEIETGRYIPSRIMVFGVGPWYELEEQIKPVRNTAIFQLALFLAQRSVDANDGDGRQGAGGNVAKTDLAGDTARVQEPLPDDDLDAVRERDQERGVHLQPGQVYQPALWAAGGDGGAQ